MTMHRAAWQGEGRGSNLHRGGESARSAGAVDPQQDSSLSFSPLHLRFETPPMGASGAATPVSWMHTVQHERAAGLWTRAPRPLPILVVTGIGANMGPAVLVLCCHCHPALTPTPTPEHAATPAPSPAMRSSRTIFAHSPARRRSAPCPHTPLAILCSRSSLATTAPRPRVQTTGEAYSAMSSFTESGIVGTSDFSAVESLGRFRAARKPLLQAVCRPHKHPAPHTAHPIPSNSPPPPNPPSAAEALERRIDSEQERARAKARFSLPSAC